MYFQEYDSSLIPEIIMSRCDFVLNGFFLSNKYFDLLGTERGQIINLFKFRYTIERKSKEILIQIGNEFFSEYGKPIIIGVHVRAGESIYKFYF